VKQKLNHLPVSVLAVTHEMLKDFYFEPDTVVRGEHVLVLRHIKFQGEDVTAKVIRLPQTQWVQLMEAMKSRNEELTNGEETKA
jgi:hypothetical protein